jgi:hypothetical protein
MGRFMIGDRICRTKYGQIIEIGYIRKGPFMIDGYNHYQLEKIWDIDGLRDEDINLITDVDTKKYCWRSINHNFFTDDMLLEYLKTPRGEFKIRQILSVDY